MEASWLRGWPNMDSEVSSDSRQKTAFVVMPFSPTASEQNWKEVFEGVFRPALEECGYECKQAETSTGSLIVSIVESLLNSDIVLADVTDRNPNVFYELGVRHSLRRGTIIVSQGSSHVPSDLRGYWWLNYGLRPAEVLRFKADIRKIIQSIEESPDRSDSPVSDYQDRSKISSSRQVNRENAKKLGALLTELSGNRLALEQWLALGNRQLLATGCLQLLLQTMYIDVGPDLLKTCYELEHKLRQLNEPNLVGSPLGMANAAQSEVGVLQDGITEIRERIVKGEFREPSVPSRMSWYPSEIPSFQTPVHADDLLQCMNYIPPDTCAPAYDVIQTFRCPACGASGAAPSIPREGVGRSCAVCGR
jgi:hypothetical protein